LAILALGFLSLPVRAQEADAGITVPVTITGWALYSHRMQGDDPAAGVMAGAFHAAFFFQPQIEHTLVCLSVHSAASKPFYYYDAFAADRLVKLKVARAFVGYTRSYKSATIVIKAGQLASAFGSFPLRYDDTENPLLDQPTSHSTYLKLRPDQLA
jgi:hypothetical protein